MAKEVTRKEVEAVLNELTKWDLISLWNEYCEDNSYYDDRIEDMGYLDDILCSCTPTEVLEAVEEGFSTRDDYFRATVYGLRSFDDPMDVIDMEDLADWVIDDGGTIRLHDYPDLMELFEDEEGEEDEDI